MEKNKSMGKVYGYLRVSSDDQDVNSQKQGVDKFAEERGWVIDEYISDEGVSGGKDPDKRNLGPLLQLLERGDKIICSEISRLGRDLYMVMDILHLCMERGCVVYTVKDSFVLGDDISSKVLAFAFGLSAEIERQMIRQRTKEGLRRRMALGVLLGRPIGVATAFEKNKYMEWRDKVAQMVEWQMSPRQIAAVLGCDRNTVNRIVHRWELGDKWKYKASDYTANSRAKKPKMPSYKDTPYAIVELDRALTLQLIMDGLTIPEIAEQMPAYTYEQIYDTILCDSEYNALYRKNGQLKVKKPRK